MHIIKILNRYRHYVAYFFNCIYFYQDEAATQQSSCNGVATS
jgi:hypothetical protein